MWYVWHKVSEESLNMLYTIISHHTARWIIILCSVSIFLQIVSCLVVDGVS